MVASRAADIVCPPIIVCPVDCWPGASRALSEPPLAGPRWAKPVAAPPSDRQYVPPDGGTVTKTLPGISESGKAARPENVRGPVVTEEGAFFDVYPVAPKAGARPAGENCEVTFLNLANRDVTLTVDGKTQVLAKGQKVVVPVPRQFIWRIEGREPQNEQVGSGASALQIVIRR